MLILPYIPHLDETEHTIQWLKHNVADFAKTAEKWKSCTGYRLDHFPDTIEDYFKLYPCLNHKLGYTLLEIDFENLFPGKEDLLIHSWQALHSHILKIASNRKDSYIKNTFEVQDTAQNKNGNRQFHKLCKTDVNSYKLQMKSLH